ncbi:MAG: HWE histidine kinase domain-containing protein [Hyphomicrobium sp.]
MLVGLEAARLSTSERTRLHQDATRTAERIAVDVDQQFNSYIAILQTLATSPALRAGNFAVVHAQANAALMPLGLFAFLRDATGQQLFNTRVEYGTPLPVSKGFDDEIFTSKQSFVSDLVYGNVARQPVLAVSVPVLNEDKTLQYVLSLSLSPELIKRLLDNQSLAPGWSAIILDRANVVLARAWQNERFFATQLTGEQIRERRRGMANGQDLEGRTVMRGAAKSRLTGWSVYVAVPASLADEAVRSALLGYAGLVSILSAFGLAGAFAVGRVIAKPLDEAAAQAKALGEGRALSYRPTMVREANAISQALVEAARLRDEADEQIFQLMREVSHRSKNMLAVVQAIARQMTGTDPKMFVRRLSDRIIGLAASQDLLIENNWQGVHVSDLVASQLSPFREFLGTRVVSNGAPVRLTPSAAQAVGMALHELATNASKYGALSGDKGNVDIRWDIDGSDDAREFCIEWRENGGPKVNPPEKLGYGHTIMVLMVEKSLDAKVGLSFPPEGLVWQLRASAQCTWNAEGR